MVLQTALEISPEEAALLVRLGKDVESRAKELGPCKGVAVEMLLDLKGVISKGEAGTSGRKVVPATEQVVAWFLSQLNKDARDKLYDKFVASCQDGALPNQTPTMVSEARTMLLAATAIKTGPRAGSLTGSCKVSSVDTTKFSPKVKKDLDAASRLIELDFAPGKNDEESE